jgi:hypothetical protein
VHGMASYNNVLAIETILSFSINILKFTSFEIAMHVIEDHNV